MVLGGRISTRNTNHFGKSGIMLWLKYVQNQFNFDIPEKNSIFAKKIIMEKIKVAVDFKQLLEDITFTNKIMKTFDMSELITRNQYYQLKDYIILWLAKHDFTQTTIDDEYEYLISKTHKRIELLKLTISYKDTKCLIHQNAESKIRKVLNFNPSKPTSVKYEPTKYEGLELNTDTKLEFINAISRLKATRITLLRSTMDLDSFENSYATNLSSQDPWMKRYRIFLPKLGMSDIEIIEYKEENERV